jgi:hypothetical protein
MVPLLDKYEKVTYEHLKPVCEKNGAMVFAKVRLKDVLPVDGSGISSGDYRFSLQAHFDFIVVNNETKPLFAVEYDGTSHASPQQVARDHRKNALCERFDLSLLRINSRYMEAKYRELNLLAYFVEVWFMSDAFYDAQQKGFVPYDEDFTPWLVFSDGRSKKRYPFWLSADAQVALQRLGDTRKISEPIPSNYVGIDKAGTYRCLSWIKVTPSEYAVVTTGMRLQQFPIIQSELISEIAVCDLYEKVQAILSGKANSISESQFQAMLKGYEKRYKMCAFSGYSHYHEKIK